VSELIEIERADDPRLAPFRLNERGLATRADRRDDSGAGLFLAEGDLVVERAWAAGCRPSAALADAERVPPVARELAGAGIDVFIGGDDVRRLVTRLGMPQTVVALFHRPPRPTAGELVERADRLVVVEGVDNPVNIGSIVRNAAAFGWDGLLLDHTSADPLSRRALRVAMGTAFSLPHARTNDLVEHVSTLVDAGGDVYALTPVADAIDIRTLRPARRRALLIGAERSGLSAALLDVATPARIPMAGTVDSLNAAAAAAIACYALA
jgi:tRNA G18 (ribose-2'-O)-methylase SpoU